MEQPKSFDSNQNIPRVLEDLLAQLHNNNAYSILTTLPVIPEHPDEDCTERPSRVAG